MKDKVIPFNKWTFVDQHGRDDNHWYIRLEGGVYHDVIYRYMKVSLNMDEESINFDYEVVDYPMENTPHGDELFTAAAGEILKSIMDDATLDQDYKIGGPKPGEKE